jgi:hypothetical protein
MNPELFVVIAIGAFMFLVLLTVMAFASFIIYLQMGGFSRRENGEQAFTPIPQADPNELKHFLDTQTEGRFTNPPTFTLERKVGENVDEPVPMLSEKRVPRKGKKSVMPSTIPDFPETDPGENPVM